MPNHFDTVAKDWDNNKMHIDRTKAIAACILETLEINKEMKALEFGAGTGLLSFALKNHFALITLMDSSEEMIKATFEKIIYAKERSLIPVFFDLEKKNYTEQKFDMVFSQMVMHHVKDIDKMFDKFYGLLNKKGKLAIADLYTEDGTFHDFKFDGHYGFDPFQLAETLMEKGFYNLRIQECYVIKRDVGEKQKKKFPVFLLTAEK
jgi:ubiquinone/menaquinone biosynthesis C-methylase UbiE